ncbi:hypothetical protein K4H28_11655 [Deefgea tanakiae]|uniref:Uncharacterized protein n=1 Tax=Deefgea tanakiae TaxID=2865840 RepID=A0ABX8Z305_9NEIS|nr:hypothetical protein [Deefgea tanakiae]QZA76959.1 hypothetical protein K4H28_11655 [Deefgea tanakiae]
MNMPLARQSGATLLILMLVMMTVFATLLVSNLRGRNPEDIRREQSAAAIEKARQALLVWSLSRTSSGSSVDSPVELPCPADPNEAALNSIGVSRSSCNSAGVTGPAARTGWLPWKTLGIPKLVDGYGEPLWYSVDLGFVARTKDESRKVNGDSFAALKVYSGTNELTLNGQGAAAVIFAAGPPVDVQTRASPLAAAQYLEGLTVSGPSNATHGGPYVTSELKKNSAGETIFNDQLGVITGRSLIDAARTRLGSEIAKKMLAYYQAVQAEIVSGGGGGGVACVAPWDANVTYQKNDVASYAGHNWSAKNKNSNNTPPPPSNKAGWKDDGACNLASLVQITAPYPANLLTDTACQNNSLALGICPSQENLCAGILPRAADSWTGATLLSTPASNKPLWFQQNIWHRGVVYAVKQGLVCTTPFIIDGVTDATIDALYIIPGAARTRRANNLLTPDTVAMASTNLALYLDDAENQDAWTADNYRYVTPSCTSNDLMYTCSKGICNKRKSAC